MPKTTEIQPADINEQFLVDYPSFASNGATSDPDWLAELRMVALDRFRALRFPTLHDEEWRFTNLTSLLRRTFRVATDRRRIEVRDIENFTLALPNAIRLVFVDGRYAADLSTPAEGSHGVLVGNIAQMSDHPSGVVRGHLGRVIDAGENAFTALNTAYIHDGAVVYVPAGRTISEPIQLIYLASGASEDIAAHQRALIVLERSAAATVVETYGSLNDVAGFSNSATEIVLGENASLDFYKLQLENDSTFHVGTVRADQDRDSRLRSFGLTLGGALTRNNIALRFGGEGIESWLNGLYLASGSQHIDNHTFIDHAVPHCTSHEVYKGILSGSARGVFSGKVLVRTDAQKTDARQTNRNLLLSHDAKVNTKPQLEIFADDVKCTHGATVGQLDPESVFYLKSRGMSPESARTLLTHGFAMEILEAVEIPSLRDALDQLVLKRLEAEVQHV